MSVTTAKIEIDLNDAAFLSAILTKWMKSEDMETIYLKDLAAHLAGTNPCEEPAPVVAVVEEKKVEFKTIETTVTKIAIEDIETTYNGEQGCACGCGGDYATPADNLEVATKRLGRINARLKSKHSDVDAGGNYFSLEGDTRATRVYFHNNISYKKSWDGALIRVERVPA